MVFRYFLAWFGLMILAILNGALREGFFKRYMDDPAAHQLSTLTLLILITIYFLFIIRFWPIESSSQAWIIGTMWLIMTEVFEFGMGLVISKIPLSRILQEYNILAGRLWILIPLWTLFSPIIFYKFVQHSVSN